MDTKEIKKYISLKEFCKKVGISTATGKNWLKLGKIKPSEIISDEVYFDSKYIKKLLNDLQNGKNSNLKSRRNKKFKNGFGLYISYIPKNSQNLSSAEMLTAYFENKSLVLSQNDIKEIIAYYSLQILKTFSAKDIKKYEYLCRDIALTDKIIKKHPLLKEIKFIYEPDTDILGLLYMSLNGAGSRKSRGSYFTPTQVVQKLIDITFKKYLSGIVTDPCCGSGNFVLLLPSFIKPENIYAFDIDELSVKITRINFALKYKISDKNFLYEHIKVQDFLTGKNDKKYDYIVGNPPWAFDFDDKIINFLRKSYKTAQGTNVESYDVITEKALKSLNKNGILSFVLPEAVLNVKSHKRLREILIKKNSVKYLEYLGETFDGVQCPSIIVKICHDNSPFNTEGMTVKTKDREFIINQKRKINTDCFDFTCNDAEYNLLQKIENIPDKVTLKNNAQFALGIVTGNNKKYLSKFKNKNNEFVFKGSDIDKYKIKTPKNCILFNPNDFQQCANEKFYRAKEKLLYKFISKKLVFAYDDKQRVTLNSCNILIPQIKNLDIKYILGILNSSVAQFYFEKKFNSLKVLRSHIEQIPIPYVDSARQKPVIDLTDKILSGCGNYDILCKNIDYNCCLLYGIEKDLL